MGIININGKTFHFQDVELTYENSHVIDVTIAKKNLLDFKKIMDSENIVFCIMHGTLLGAIREKRFIGHDIDIDTCVLDEQKLIEAIPMLDSEGLKLCRYEPTGIYSFIRNGVYIDVYIVNELKGIMNPFYVRYLYKVIPRKFFKNLKTMEFLGETFTIPNHTLQLLEFWYGKNWRIPTSNAPSNDVDKVGKFLNKHFHCFFQNK